MRIDRLVITLGLALLAVAGTPSIHAQSDPAPTVELTLPAESLGSGDPSPGDLIDYLGCRAGQPPGRWELQPEGEWVTTPLGAHRSYLILHDGLPVLDAALRLHRDAAGRIRAVTLPRFLIDAPAPAARGLRDAPAAAIEHPHTGAPRIARAQALALATRALGEPVAAGAPSVLDAWQWADGALTPIACVTVALDLPRRDERLVLDACSGAILQRADLLCHALGAGLAFLPNPVTASGRRELREGDDVDPYRDPVTLNDLDGEGMLRGRWALIENPRGESVRPDLRFEFSARDPHFEEVMAYHHITETQRYLQALGYAHMNARPQRAQVHASPDDDSWFSPATHTIGFGDGGVDDAEDADVIIHEYGHALFHDVVGETAGADVRALGEGFADYLAASRTEDARIGDWDGAALAEGCLRDIGLIRRYPADLTGDAHADGRIWSGLLWRIRARAGARGADLLALETLYRLTPGTTWPQAAGALRGVAADLQAAGLGDGLLAVTQAEMISAGLLPNAGERRLAARGEARFAIALGFALIPAGGERLAYAESLLVCGDGTLRLPSPASSTSGTTPLVAPLVPLPDGATGWCDSLGVRWRAGEGGIAIEQQFLSGGLVRREATTRIFPDGRVEIEWGGAGDTRGLPCWCGYFPAGSGSATRWIEVRDEPRLQLGAGEGVALRFVEAAFDLRGALWEIAPDADGAYRASLRRGPTPEPRPQPAALTVTPTATRSQTTLILPVTRPGSYELEIFDATGRRIAPPLQRAFPAGLHAWTIAPRDRGGSPLPGGLYWLRVSGPGGCRTGRLAIVH